MENGKMVSADFNFVLHGIDGSFITRTSVWKREIGWFILSWVKITQKCRREKITTMLIIDDNQSFPINVHYTNCWFESPIFLYIYTGMHDSTTNCIKNQDTCTSDVWISMIIATNALLLTFRRSFLRISEPEEQQPPWRTVQAVSAWIPNGCRISMEKQTKPTKWSLAVCVCACARSPVSSLSSSFRDAKNQIQRSTSFIKKLIYNYCWWFLFLLHYYIFFGFGFRPECALKNNQPWPRMIGCATGCGALPPPHIIIIAKRDVDVEPTWECVMMCVWESARNGDSGAGHANEQKHFSLINNHTTNSSSSSSSGYLSRTSLISNQRQCKHGAIKPFAMRTHTVKSVFDLLVLGFSHIFCVYRRRCMINDYDLMATLVDFIRCGASDIELWLHFYAVMWMVARLPVTGTSTQHTTPDWTGFGGSCAKILRKTHTFRN